MKKSLLLMAVSLFPCGLATPLMAAALNDTSTLIDQAPASDVTSETPTFTGSIEDLPLMPGLHPVPEDDVIFVTPRSGRIADSTAEGAVDVDDVYNFYATSLPHLGWTVIDSRSYRRENEILRIDAHADGKVTRVRFSVKPRN
jgi:hypothetical protein